MSRILIRGLFLYTVAIVDHQSGDEEDIQLGHTQIGPISVDGSEKEERSTPQKEQTPLDRLQEGWLER